jgi:hypothetical protein
VCAQLLLDPLDPLGRELVLRLQLTDESPVLKRLLQAAEFLKAAADSGGCGPVIGVQVKNAPVRLKRLFAEPKIPGAGLELLQFFGGHDVTLRPGRSPRYGGPSRPSDVR